MTIISSLQPLFMQSLTETDFVFSKTSFNYDVLPSLFKLYEFFFSVPDFVSTTHFFYFLPECILLAGLCYLLASTVFFKPQFTNLFQTGFIILTTTLIAFVILINETHGQAGTLLFYDFFIFDNFTLWNKFCVYLFFYVVYTLSWAFYKKKFENVALLHASKKILDYPFYAILCLLFIFVFISANDLIVLYLALEGLSLVIFILAISNNISFKVVEAGIKYFCLSIFTSAFLIYGISLIYGLYGTTNFVTLNQLLYTLKEICNTTTPSVQIIALFFVFLSFFFKIGAAPFHFWITDVYSGVESPITALLMIPIKYAFIVVLTKLLSFTFQPIIASIQPILMLFGLGCLTLGSLSALYHDELKKFIAASSVNQVGFLLVGLAIATVPAVQATLMHLNFYLIANVLFFSVLLTQSPQKTQNEIQYFSDFNTFGQSNPIGAMLLAISFLSMAGIPPLAGFFGKYLIMVSVANHSSTTLLIIMLILTVLSAFYYIRPIKILLWSMISKKPAIQTPALQINPKLQPLVFIYTTIGCLFLILGQVFCFEAVNRHCSLLSETAHYPLSQSVDISMFLNTQEILLHIERILF